MLHWVMGLPILSHVALDVGQSERLKGWKMTDEWTELRVRANVSYPPVLFSSVCSPP
jgi:hypothetical protein